MSDSFLVRPYRGVAAGDRVSNRRDALIDAALQVFAADGWASISARRVCERAGLTRRYFYESFADIDALLGAALDRITGEVTEAVRAAVADGSASRSELVRRAVRAGLDVLASTPSKGRFLAASLTAGRSIAAHRARSISDLAAIIEAALSPQRDDHATTAREARITAIIAVGAILSIIDSWLTQEVDLTKEEVVAWSATAAIGIIDAVAADTQ
ncbi:MAG: TetR/AcrR family transcriptional regulator [Solirubrobacteraceae bacterium]